MHHSRSANAGSGRTVHSIYRAVALVTALALLLTAGFTALAGGNALAESAAAPVLPEQPSSGLPETVHAKIREISPDIADKLVPLNLSSEKQGIRIDLLSALAKGNEAWLVMAFQAPKDSPLDISNVGFFEFDIHFDLAYKTIRSEQTILEYDEAANRVTRLLHIINDEPIKPEDRTVNLDLSDLQVIEYTEIDLLPYLKEYGTEQEGIDPPAFQPRYYPDENSGMLKKAPEADKFLDYAHPQDIPLHKTFTLTGIGWIDGKLHVQIHNSEDGIWPSVYISNYMSDLSKDLDTETLNWNDIPDPMLPNWYELVSSAAPEDVDRMVLNLSLQEVVDVIREKWAFRFPLLSILAD